MAFVANNSSVYDLLNDKLYSIPVNQRKYVWDENNWQELFDDIRLAYETKKPDHFIGSIVLKEETNDLGIKNSYSIIDGQQRISTLTIMLSVISVIFAELGEEGLFQGLEKNLFVKNVRSESFTILSKNANKDISKVIEILQNDIITRMEGRMPIPSLEEVLKVVKPPKKISDCFLFFYKKTKELIDGDKTKLEQFMQTVQDVKYVDIVAKNDEDAFTIFEILNARGQPLRDFDMVKNFLLKYSPNNEKELFKDILSAVEDLLDNSIDMFLKHYVIHKYGKKSDKNERPYRIIVTQEKNNDKKFFLLDLLKKAQYYRKIISYEKCTDLEKKIFSYFKPRRQQQFRPLVLGMMHQLEQKNMDQETYDRYLQFLYEFFIYFHVIGEEKSNKIEDIVYKYASLIENQFSINILLEMKKSMSSRIPNEVDFANSIKNVKYSARKWKAFTGGKKAENVNAIFEIIEKENGYTGLFDSTITIEHIHPESQAEENTTLGNLMLIEKKYNEECKDKPLEQKIPIYQKSKLTIPKTITTDLDINNRTQEIAILLYSFISKLKG